MSGHLAFGGHEPELAALGLGAAALRYQGMGYAVLALAPGTKRPHKLFQPPAGFEGTGGHKWATTDAGMVHYVWSRDRLAGIGIATGVRSRLLVVDLDVKSGANGTISLMNMLAASQLSLPSVPAVMTPSGGWHLWFALPGGTEAPTRIGILPGVDVKCADGYVAAPPTRIFAEGLDRPGEHGGGGVLLPYRWFGRCPCVLPEAPSWLLDWITSAPPTRAELSGHGGDRVDLAGLERTGLAPGERNIQVHRIACSLYREYGTHAAADAAVRNRIARVLAATDTRGLTEGEVSRAIASARRFVQRSSEAEAAANPGNITARLT